MTPDELLKALKRYLEKSGDTERAVASRIGINHHILRRWLSDEQSPKKRKAGANRVLSKARGILVSILDLRLLGPDNADTTAIVATEIP